MKVCLNIFLQHFFSVMLIQIAQNPAIRHGHSIGFLSGAVLFFNQPLHTLVKITHPKTNMICMIQVFASFITSFCF